MSRFFAQTLLFVNHFFIKYFFTGLVLILFKACVMQCSGKVNVSILQEIWYPNPLVVVLPYHFLFQKVGVYPANNVQCQDLMNLNSSVPMAMASPIVVKISMRLLDSSFIFNITGCEQKNGPPTSKMNPLSEHFYSIKYHFDSLFVLPSGTKQNFFDLFCQKLQKLLGKLVKNGVNLTGRGSIFLLAPCMMTFLGA